MKCEDDRPRRLEFYGRPQLASALDPGLVPVCISLVLVNGLPEYLLINVCLTQLIKSLLIQE